MIDDGAQARFGLPPAQLVLAEGLHDEALRMSALVANLLDMARLQSGQVKLNLEWQALEEAEDVGERQERQEQPCSGRNSLSTCNEHVRVFHIAWSKQRKQTFI